MELGATLCKPTNPDCDHCPVASLCKARELVVRRKDLETNAKGSGEMDIEDLLRKLPVDVTEFPNKPPKKKPKEMLIAVYVLAITNTPEPSFLLLKRPKKGLLANQLEFPSISLWEESKDNSATSLQSTVSGEELWAKLPGYINEIIGCTWDKKMTSRQCEGDSADRCIYPLVGGREITMESSPIVHVFSHQKHNMLLSIKEVTFESHSSSKTWKCTANEREVYSYSI